MSNLSNWSVEIYHHTVNMQFHSFTIVRSCRIKWIFLIAQITNGLGKNLNWNKNQFLSKLITRIVFNRDDDAEMSINIIFFIIVFLSCHTTCVTCLSTIFFKQRFCWKNSAVHVFFAQTNIKKWTALAVALKCKYNEFLCVMCERDKQRKFVLDSF